MTKATKTYEKDKELVIATLSRGDVRAICGDAVAERLSDEGREHLAHEMTEACSVDSFAQDLQRIIAGGFSKPSEGEGK
jgi:hypothetical protein